MPYPSDTSIQAAIEHRVSVRSYTPGVLDKTTVHALLAAAVRAPTAMHAEPWQFVIIQDRAVLRRISDCAKPLFLAAIKDLHRGDSGPDHFAQPDFNVFYDAGTLVVICTASTGHFEVADCWLAAGNLMLAACGMGLGSCVIGSAVAALDLPEIRQLIGLPPGTTAVAPIIVGKPRGETPVVPRKPPHILAWR